MAERECKILDFELGSRVLDLIFEVKRDTKSKSNKRKLGLAIDTIKEACSITDDDVDIGEYGYRLWK